MEPKQTAVENLELKDYGSESTSKNYAAPLRMARNRSRSWFFDLK